MFWRNLTHYLLLIPWLLTTAVIAATPQQLLDEAEQKRTRMPQETVLLLEKLANQFDNLTEYEQHQLKFLQAYMLGFQGKQQESLQLATEIQHSQYPDIRIKANLVLATVSEHRKDYVTAYNALYLAMQSLSADIPSPLQVNVYTVATQLHLSAGAFERAYQYASTLLQLASSPREHCIGAALQLHAQIRKEKQYNEISASNAKKACSEAQELLMEESVTVFTAEVDVLRHPLLVQQRMEHGLQQLAKLSYQYTTMRAQYFLAYASLELQQPEKALPLLTEIQTQANRLQDNRTSNETLFLLARTYEQLGQLPQALATYKAHIQALNTYLQEFQARNIAFHLAQTDSIERESRLAILKSQNEVLRLEQQLQKQHKGYTLAIGMCLFTFCVLIIYFLNRKRADLNRLATTDFLTKLFNRRYFSEAVNRQLANRRKQADYSLIVFDIDLFKQINDQYGHAAGDQVLSLVADRCSRHIRKQDILARIGGEEFAVFLPGCNLPDAIKLAEQLRQSLADEPIDIEKQAVTVSASFGVAASAQANFEQLLHQADAALYQAKAAGRNCVRDYTAD